MNRLAILVPYAWLAVFFALPLAIVAGISLSESRVGVPPYEPLLEWAEGGAITLHAHLGNFLDLLREEVYLGAYLTSLRIAGVSTLICLLLGFPMAYAIARAEPRRRGPLLMLVVLPFWTSFLVRIYAWMGILKDEGILSGALMGLGLIDQPLVIVDTELAVYIGVVYSYLPFMVLPLYATLEKLDPALLEAAADLGARPWRSFLSVVLPLSMPGVAAGALLVFIPAAGEYVIPDLLGGGETHMLGNALWDVFALNRDWPMAAALAVGLLAAMVLPLALLRRLAGGDEIGP